MNDLKVHIAYRNSEGHVVNDRLYNLGDYTDQMRVDLLKVISDVEDLIYLMSRQSKEDWPDDVWNSFMGIKHKLLDKANDIGRLPQTLVQSGDK